MPCPGSNFHLEAGAILEECFLLQTETSHTSECDAFDYLNDFGVRTPLLGSNLSQKTGPGSVRLLATQMQYNLGAKGSENTTHVRVQSSL